MTESELVQRLDRFLAGLPLDMIADRAAAESGRDKDSVAQTLATFRNEAHVTLNLVAARLKPGMRLLEVGAGLCLFSLFLRREGYDITALEPAIGGYSLFDILRRLILEHYPEPPLPVLTCPAGELEAASHGCFDLVFSNNVVEHIPDWRSAFTAMLGVLAENGSMLHACPNYSVPYEPHYGVPVLRRLPGLSRRLFLPDTADAEIWDSLNFLCHRQVRGYARRHGCTVRFEPGLIHRALMRLQSDPLFRERHKGAVAGLAGFLAASGVLSLLRYLPAAMATPMIFEMRPEGAD